MTRYSQSESDSQSESESQSQMLLTDPKVVGKIMADELNSLSFDDREALSEEIHGVRSLAPNETPEMIHNALLDLHKEIENRLTIALSILSSSQSSLHKGNGKNGVSRREYLSDLLVASKSLASSSSPASASASASASVQSNCSSNPSSKISLFSGETSIAFESNDFNPTSSSNNNNNNKYSYVISRGFRIKFLRAELFDVKKAAARYLICIDFLVDYFGLVALQRPLYLKDLDKDEHILLKEGRCQLMPSRDRFGRRIIVFLGAMGKRHSQRNRLKLCMYLIFQVASDDETTQCKGLVALYTLHDNSAISFVQLALHTTECKKFFDAVPLRYSAIHCFTNDDMSVILGIIFNMIGKGRNLRMRANIASSVTETFYKLRCFGIPTEDFPVTSSGSIKTKRLMKFIKFRVALEEAHERGDELPSYHQLQPMSTLSSCETTRNHHHHPTPSPFLGIECPRLDSVIFRNGGSAWDHPGNIKFRGFLAKMEPKREFLKTMAEKNSFWDGILLELLSSGMTFLVYDNEKDWYLELQDYGMLRKKVYQALRDQSVRRKRSEMGTTPYGEREQRRQRVGSNGRSDAIATHQVNESSTSLFMEL